MLIIITFMVMCKIASAWWADKPIALTWYENLFEICKYYSWGIVNIWRAFIFDHTSMCITVACTIVVTTMLLHFIKGRHRTSSGMVSTHASADTANECSATSTIQTNVFVANPRGSETSPHTFGGNLLSNLSSFNEKSDIRTSLFRIECIFELNRIPRQDWIKYFLPSISEESFKKIPNLMTLKNANYDEFKSALINTFEKRTINVPANLSLKNLVQRIQNENENIKEYADDIIRIANASLIDASQKTIESKPIEQFAVGLLNPVLREKALNKVLKMSDKPLSFNEFVDYVSRKEKSARQVTDLCLVQPELASFRKTNDYYKQNNFNRRQYNNTDHNAQYNTHYNNAQNANYQNAQYQNNSHADFNANNRPNPHRRANVVNTRITNVPATTYF